MKNLPLGWPLAVALCGVPMLAQADAWVTFSGAAAPATTVTGPLAAEDSRHVDSAEVTADYTASASLATGILRAQVSGTPKISFTSSPMAMSEARILEQFQIAGPGTAPVPLQFRMDVDAVMTVDPAMGANALDSLYLAAYMTVNSSIWSTMEIQRYKTIDASGVVTDDFIQCVGQPCDLNQPLTLAGVVDGQFVLNLMLSPGFTYTFDAALQVHTTSTPGTFGEVDASHTARLSYTLPAGYTLDSESGVFLSAVPEPQAWALWAAGLLGVAGLRRRTPRGDGQA